jgi:protease I
LADISGKRIAISAADGFEQAEREVPQRKLKEAGAAVDVVSPKEGQIEGWDKTDWGHPVKVDKRLNEANAGEYDAIVLPGGQLNPDYLRVNEGAIFFIKNFYSAGKAVAAVCHAPWLLMRPASPKAAARRPISRSKPMS